MSSVGYAATKMKEPLVPFSYQTRPVGDDDIEIVITHCGLCHSDLHQINNEWGGSIYPMVPGHEIIGEVKQIGKNVRKFKVGDRAGVGCYINSCGSCELCKKGNDQYCSKATFTYNSLLPDGSVTYGGYCNRIVLLAKYACTIPSNLSSASAAPLLCAGITLYSPMIHHGVKEGMNIGIIGLGGLGHMGIKLGKAFGCNVTVFSTSPNKQKEALEELKADNFVIYSNPGSMKTLRNQFDILINTAAGAVLDFKAFLPLLKVDGKFIFVGVSQEPHKIDMQALLFRRLTVTGSLIGSVDECQKMLEFCAEKNVAPIVEILPVSEVNTALNRLSKNDVHYRFVLQHPKL